MRNKHVKEHSLVISGGTYLNKGGAAITYGTLNVFKELKIGFRYIIDPDPSFPDEFFTSYNLTPIYRWSNFFDEKQISVITPANSLKPFILCLRNTFTYEIKQLHGIPIWYIGDSSLNDYGSVLALFGQITNLLSLKLATNGKLIVNASLGYTRTKIGAILLWAFFKFVYHFFVRGPPSYNNLVNLNVSKKKISTICDFAFHLNKNETKRSIEYSNIVKKSEKPAICFIFKNYSEGQLREDYIEAIKKLERKLKKNYSLYYIPTAYVSFDVENDMFFLKRLGAENILNIKDLSPEEIIDVFSNFEAVVTMRLHGAVFSTLAGVPTYHIYEADNSLDVIKGTFNELVPLQYITDFIYGDPETIVDDLLDLIQRKEEISHNMKYCIDEEKKRSIEILKLELSKILNLQMEE